MEILISGSMALSEHPLCDIIQDIPPSFWSLRSRISMS